MKRLLFALAALVLLAAPRPSTAQERGAAALGELIDGLGVNARVLVIGAHPDDEDTRLITWLARGRQVRTAYLSLTRGDGGQNLIGNELGEALGVVRTEELLAARRTDGGVQFFTRAYDFGYSKSAEETFRHWPRDSILHDVVTVVRAFRPHVIVTLFTGTSRDGHGHHQASGILAREAYELAGDTVRMPRAINPWNLAPWTVAKLYQSARFAPDQATLAVNVGEYNPLLGRSYAEIAAESRSQHKSQGFGALQPRGVVMNYLRREHSRVFAPADPQQERSIFDGIEITTVGQLRSLELHPVYYQRIDSIPEAIAAVRAASLRRPDLLTARLEALRSLLVAGGLDHDGGSVVFQVIDRHGQSVAVPPEAREVFQSAFARTSHALALASGVFLEAQAERELVATGDSVPVTLTVYNRGPNPVRVTPERFFSCQAGERSAEDGNRNHRRVVEPDSAALILPDSARAWRGVFCAGDTPTQPYWLMQPRDGAMFARASTHLPEDLFTRGPVLRATVALEGAPGTLPFQLDAHIVRRFADPVRGDVRRPVAVVPRVAVLLERTVEYAPANTPLQREVRVQLRSGLTEEETVRARIVLPAGLHADSAVRAITLAPGGVRSVSFRVSGQLRPGRDSIRVVAEGSGGESYAQGYTLVEYEHIRPQRLYRPATTVLEAVDVRLPPGPIGYIPGVADNVAPMLEQLGLRVSVLDPAALPTTNLSGFGAVVIGPRAYASRPELIENNALLLEYVRRGGTLVVQYGQYDMMQPGLMPYPVTISRPHFRVTDETAPVRVLRPDHPLLNTPNRIGQADFDGWVQERGLYMPVAFDDAYTPLLAMSDPGESSNEGAVLVASYGQGTYVYTTLAFFRQLPAGVPGAARLFVNLLGAGR